MHKNELQTATLANGCFWCTEAVFQRLKGVVSVAPGYAGGTEKNPSYELIETGTTNYAQAIQIKFDPETISYNKILDVFWKTHDPTTPNRQGNDIGPQYRSVIFYHNEEQKEIAVQSKETVDKSDLYDDPIVTEIVPFKGFYEAEAYHHDFYNNNRQNGYCQLIIDPKLQNLMKNFKEHVKENN